MSEQPKASIDMQADNPTDTRREQALVRALGRALRVAEHHDLDEAVRISDELAKALHPLPGHDIVLDLDCSDDTVLTLNCTDHLILFPPLKYTLGEFRERLVDLFSRMHHEPEIARSIADAVVQVLLLHLEADASA